MLHKIIWVISLFFFFTGCKEEPKNNNQIRNLKEVWIQNENQLSKMVDAVALARATEKNTSLVSPRTIKNGKLKLVPSNDWCSGFFPGCLWLLYQHTGKSKWKKEAEEYTSRLADQQWNGSTHDMGFKMYCSYGNGYRLTGDTTYKRILIQSAKTLITRFNPKVGCIRSWDHHQDKWKFPVIIDNMMNLELLFWATKVTGDSVYYKVAESHALTTLKNHFRSDYSCYHVVDYDPATGKVLHKQTLQGYSDQSSWARGQAWALYGFTMAYRETLNPLFLNQAKHIAHFIFSNPNMPKDLIPYWDFDAPGIPNEPRDVSAAAVIASALLELEKYTPATKADFHQKAITILNHLNTFYRCQRGNGQPFILDHSTGSRPQNSEVDVPLIYADYYYLEALCRSVTN